jgi:hypothetical protein
MTKLAYIAWRQSSEAIEMLTKMRIAFKQELEKSRFRWCFWKRDKDARKGFETTLRPALDSHVSFSYLFLNDPF